jgi:hypothetical protein
MPIYQFHAPTESSCKPIESSEPILTPGYKLDSGFVDMIRNLSFLGEGNANPNPHLREFEQICDLFSIEGMSYKTIRWKLFLFYLTEKAKQWYHKTVGSVQGDWGTLRSEFFFKFFPISRIARLWREILNFEQHDEEPFVTA